MNDVWALVVVALPLLAMWIAALVETVRRHDLTGGRKVAWIGALLLLPVVGLAVYLVARPPRTARASRGRAGQARAESVVVLAERRQRGEIDEETYRTEIATVSRA